MFIVPNQNHDSVPIPDFSILQLRLIPWILHSEQTSTQHLVIAMSELLVHFILKNVQNLSLYFQKAFP